MCSKTLKASSGHAGLLPSHRASCHFSLQTAILQHRHLALPLRAPQTRPVSCTSNLFPELLCGEGGVAVEALPLQDLVADNYQSRRMRVTHFPPFALQISVRQAGA